MRLTTLNDRRLSPASPEQPVDYATQTALLKLEEGFLQAERERVRHLAADAPSTPDAFVEWFTAQRSVGPGQGDPLFDWLESEATMPQMRWFIRQEVVGEAGFDDLIALTQLKMPARVKLEMARNYWDEMGRGRERAMHGPMLERTARLLNAADPSLGPLLWQASALGNVMAGLASNRRWAYHSAGALGAVELTAPTRTAKVVKGMQRLGVRREATHYFALHSTVDVAHSDAWVSEVLWPLVDRDGRIARWLAEGALMRLNAGARCFDAYRAHFGLQAPQAHRSAPGVAA